MQKEEEVAARAREFKAQPFDMQGIAHAATRKAAPHPVPKLTVAKGPSFMTEKNTYHDIVKRGEYRNTHAAHDALQKAKLREKQVCAAVAFVADLGLR